MSTYSINIGTVTESTSLGSIDAVLNQIPNNTTHLVSPKDLRDAFYTAWTSNIFKPTTVTSSNVEYIGSDSSQTGIDTKEKIYLGKRRLSGSDIMNNTLLTSDSDIFIYNTKSDSGLQNTKVSFLGGASSSLFSFSPSVETLYVIGTSSNYLDFNIKNPSGNINIESIGRNVSINGLIFPTLAETYTNAANGYVLKYNNGALEWNSLSGATLDTISGATVSITGNKVLINGNNIEFTNSNPILQTLGGITAGMTFSSEALVNVLNTLLYPYLPPTMSFVLSATSVIPGALSGSETNSLLAEYGSLSTLSYKYDITKKSMPITSILSSPGGTFPPSPTILSGTSSLTSIMPVSAQIYTLSITDVTSIISTTASLTYTYPYFYLVTTSSINFGSVSPSIFNKVLVEKSDVTVTLSGTNSHIYFLYPSSYGNLSHIVDSSTGWDFISSFTKIESAISLTSSSPYWSGTYNVYSYTSGSGLTTVNSDWTFKH